MNLNKLNSKFKLIVVNRIELKLWSSYLKKNALINFYRVGKLYEHATILCIYETTIKLDYYFIGQ